MPRLAVLALACAVAGVPASAHHSAAATYDADHTLTLAGQVAEFAWRNPHCFLYLDVEAGPFKGQRYVVEMSSLGVLTTQGWTRLTLKAGDHVSVEVMPARTGKAAGLCRNCDIRINGKVTKTSLVQ
jgi:hypothetical protein